MRVKKEFRLDSNDFGFIWAGVSYMVSYKRNVWYNLLLSVVCYELTAIWAPSKKMLVSWQISGPYGITKYASGWRKDVVNQCLEFGLLSPLQAPLSDTFLQREEECRKPVLGV